MKEYKQVWMYMKTYEKLRENFQAYEDEKVVDYFERIADFINNIKWRVNKTKLK